MGPQRQDRRPRSTGGIDLLFKKGGVTAYRVVANCGSIRIEIILRGLADGECKAPNGDGGSKSLLCPGSIPARLPSGREDGETRIGKQARRRCPYPECRKGVGP